MGVDAVIMVKIQQPEEPTDHQLKTWSFAICSALGAHNFFIKDGLLPAEYAKAKSAWSQQFRAHQDAGRTREEIVWKIGEYPVERRLAFDLERRISDHEIPVSVGEWLLHVSLRTRYYGIGYERGDLLTIIAVAEWCEQNLPHAEIWYGGDSGEPLELFTEESRKNLKQHFYSSNGRQYFRNPAFNEGGMRTPKPCGLCVSPGGDCVQYGYGHTVRFICYGCGRKECSTDNGTTWSIDTDKD